MDSTTTICITSVIGLALAVGAFLFGLSRGRKVTPAPSPPVPSPVQKEEDAKVTEALDRARKLKEEAEKLAGDEKQKALEKMHETIVEDTKHLADDPTALNDYLLKVGQEIKDGG